MDAVTKMNNMLFAVVNIVHHKCVGFPQLPTFPESLYVTGRVCPQ